jgi:hypothetical protein
MTDVENSVGGRLEVTYGVVTCLGCICCVFWGEKYNVE